MSLCKMGKPLPRPFKAYTVVGVMAPLPNETSMPAAFPASRTSTRRNWQPQTKWTSRSWPAIRAAFPPARRRWRRAPG